MTARDGSSSLLEGCFPQITPDLYGFRPDRPALSPDERAAAVMLSLARTQMGLAKRLGFRLGSGDSIVRLFYLHRKGFESELGLSLGRADFWWGQARDQWARLDTGHPDWGALASRLAAETGTSYLSDASILRGVVLRELLIRTHIAFANGLVVANPKELGTRRADEHSARAMALIDGEQQDETARRALHAEVDRLRVVELMSRKEWDLALRVVEQPFSPWGKRSAIALLLAAAHESRMAGRWSEALRFTDRLAREAEPVAAGPLLVDSESSATPRAIDKLREEVNAYRSGMYLRAIREEASRDDWRTAIRHASLFAREFPNHPRHAERIANLGLRAWAWAEAKGRWNDALEIAENAIKTPPAGFAQLRGLTVRFQRAGNTVGLPQAQGQPSPSQPLDNLGKAKHLGGYVGLLERLITARPESFPAFNAAASLLLLQAVNLANGQRAGQGLLAVARARAYHPGWEQLDKIEPLIVQKLDAQKTSAAELEKKFGALLRRHNVIGQVTKELSWDAAYGDGLARALLPPGAADVVEYVLAAQAGTGPRDQFLASKEPDLIKQRRERARAQWLWWLAGLPGGRFAPDDGRTAPFAEAYDLLLAKNIQNYEDMVRKWNEVRAERPDLPLAEVTPAHLATLIVNDQSSAEPDAAEAGPEAADQELEAVETRLRAEYDDPAFQAPAGSVPRLAFSGNLPAVSGLEEPLAFWAISRRGTVAKLALAAGIVLIAAALTLWWKELSFRPRRDRAFAELREALGRFDVTAALQAVRKFHSAMTLPGIDPRVVGVDQVERGLAAWRPSLRDRNTAYDQLVREFQGGDEPAVARAVEALIAIDPDSHDPRQDQARDILTQIRARADRRARDAAYNSLTPAVERGDDSRVMLASEQFLEAFPAGAQDPRGEQVLDWYSAAFTRWFIRHGTQAGSEVAAREERYKSLVLARNARSNP
jgi:hypothetical protein